MVLQYKKFNPIAVDGIHEGPIIKGKILKVVFEGNIKLENVDVDLRTREGELLVYLKGLINSFDVFYPRNEEANDYFYSFGNIYLSVQGLEEGQYIGQIYILYEGD